MRGAATLVRAAGKTLLIDCGRGVCMRLAGAAAFPPMLDALLLTHLHSDHTTDLNDVITTRCVMSPVESPLPVVGPPGTAGLVDRTLAMLVDDVRYRLDHHADLEWEPSCRVARSWTASRGRPRACVCSPRRPITDRSRRPWGIASKRQVLTAAPAAKAGARLLVLTHPVPPPAPDSDAEWVAQAAAHFDGEIVLAHDLWSISL